MTSDMVVVRIGDSLQSVQELLWKQHELPVHTDKLMVVDKRGVPCGLLFLQDILLNDPQVRVADAMRPQIVSFYPAEDADGTARAFERYELASVPVINERGKVIGRLTVDAVMDYVRESAQMEALNVAGVVDSEGLFAGSSGNQTTAIVIRSLAMGQR